MTVGVVPLSTGPFCVSQGGLLPNVHVMVPVPPVEVNVCEYGVDDAAEGSGVVVLVIVAVLMVTGGFTVTVKVCDALTAPVLSVAVTEKL